MNLIQYVIESGVSICLFTVLYLLLLQKETFFKLNRVFLLVTLLFSLLLPLMHFKVYEPIPSVLLDEIVVTPTSYMLETVSVYGSLASQTAALTISTNSWLIIIYLLGIIFFSTRTILRIVQITRYVRKSEVRKEKDIRMVILEQDIGPFSFLSWIFVSKNLLQTEGWRKMLQHEIEHVKQGHSFDILILEIISIFQWFNPFFWLLKRMIQENHEYMADQAVLRNESDPAFYKETLLVHFIGPEIRIANYFNYSLIKKRIKMMTKIRSTRIANFKMLAAVFVAVGLILLFACEQKTDVQDMKGDSKIFSLKLDSVSAVSGDSVAIMKLGKLLYRGDITISQASDNWEVVDVPQEKEEIIIVAYGKKGETINSNEEKPFVIADKMPEFPGGTAAFRKYLAESVRYPAAAHEQGIQGKVYIDFVVGKEGEIENIRIKKGVDPSLDKEAFRMISSMPRWIPGEHKGERVRVLYTQPISFML